MNPEEIRKVGKWPVRRMVGQGGFSWVYEVEDTNLYNVRRALKMLKPQAAQGEGLMRFMREVEILSPIDDPHLVRIYDQGTDAETGNRYYVMEFLTGSDLAQVLRTSGPLEAERAIEVFDGVLRGLERIHAQRPPVIHRDIKPPNIQITDDGGVKLIDFGIARRIQDGDVTAIVDENVTQMNVFIGTVKYASPEQLRVKGLSPASDIFSLGICLYEALEGRHPYQDLPELPTQSYQDVFGYYLQLDASRGALTLKFKRTPKALQQVIKRAVALKLGERFRDAREMRVALAEAAGRGAATGTRPVAVALQPPRRSRAPLIAGAAALLIAVGGGAAYFLTPSPRPKPAESESRRVAHDLVVDVDAILSAGRIEDAQAESFRSAIAGGDAQWKRDDYAAATREYDRARELGEALIEPPTPKPNDEQNANRRAAHDLAPEFEARAAKIPDMDATRFRDETQRADALWGEERYADADRAYRSAYGPGIQAIRDADRGVAPTAVEPSAPIATHPPLLDVPGSHTLQLTVDDTREIAPRASDPDGTATRITYVVRLPGGGRQTASGPRYSFTPRAPGRYTIDVTATDATGESSTVQLVANTRAQTPDPGLVVERASQTPRPPTLVSVSPAGPLSLRVGDEQAISVAANDPDSDPVTIQFTIAVTGATPARAVGSPYIFKPIAPGDYVIDVVAIDAGGAESVHKVIQATVKEKKAVSLGNEFEQFLQGYVNAWQDRDYDRLTALWQMTPADRARVQAAVDSNAVIEASARLIESTTKPGGGFADIRFEQEVTTFSGASGEPVLKGRYFAKLAKDRVGWRILFMHRE